jgi:hypothetical protein
VDNFRFAQVLSLNVEALAIAAEVEGMKALNQWREHRGEGQAYDEAAFLEKAELLWGVSQRIVTVARG